MSEDGDSVQARARREWSVAAAVLLGLLVTPQLAAGCGDGATLTTSSAPGAPGSTPAVTAGGDNGPPKFPGGVCERTTADRKSLPSWARVTVERFIAAVTRGDREKMRSLLDPAIAGDVFADLRPVSRLRLLELKDRY